MTADEQLVAELVEQLKVDSRTVRHELLVLRGVAPEPLRRSKARRAIRQALRERGLP